MARVTIEGTQYPVQKVFSDDFLFTIPFYQRPYAWTIEHASALFDDLAASMGSETTVLDDVNPYFLGSIVLVKERQTPDAEIIDGQQRIATLSILLSALRLLVQPEFAGAITPFLYHVGNPIIGTSNRYRLRLRNKDADFFQKYIQEDGGIERLGRLNPQGLSDSQLNIRNNALHLVERLRGLTEAQRFRLAQFITQKCYLVVVWTPDFDSAYRIFTILNDRGLPLSHTDILKAEIIGRLPEPHQETYNNKWEDAEERLGRDAFEELFAHIRTIYRKTKLRETVLSEIRQHVRPAETPQAFIDEVLLPLADAFDVIRNASYRSDTRADEVNALLKWLSRIDNFDWVPPALRYVSRNGDNPDNLVRFLMDLERLAACLMIRRANVNERTERYGQLLKSIEQDQDLYESSSALQLTTNDMKEALSILDGAIYLSKKVCPYVLLRLDAHLSQGEASYNFQSISIEHVLPQTPSPGSQWERWFPQPIHRFQWVHRLANLVLLSTRKNSQAQNYDFEKKKQRYFTTKKGVSPFALTTQVLRETEWTEGVLSRRQTELLAFLAQIWRLSN